MSSLLVTLLTTSRQVLDIIFLLHVSSSDGVLNDPPAFPCSCILLILLHVITNFIVILDPWSPDSSFPAFHPTTPLVLSSTTGSFRLIPQFNTVISRSIRDITIFWALEDISSQARVTSPAPDFPLIFFPIPLPFDSFPPQGVRIIEEYTALVLQIEKCHKDIQYNNKSGENSKTNYS